MTASLYDIHDASKLLKMSESKQQEMNYLKSIDDIMQEKLKNPKNNLFDTEALI